MKKKPPPKDEEERVHYLGYLERVDAPWGLDKSGAELAKADKVLARRRTYFVFDCVRAEAFRKSGEYDSKELAYIFLSTTSRKFGKIAELGQVDTDTAPPEGGWYLI